MRLGRWSSAMDAGWSAKILLDIAKKVRKNTEKWPDVRLGRCVFLAKTPKPPCVHRGQEDFIRNSLPNFDADFEPEGETAKKAFFDYFIYKKSKSDVLTKLLR